MNTRADPIPWRPARPGRRVALATAALVLCGAACAQVAGARRLGTTVTQEEQAVAGWSAKQSLLNRTVHDATGQRLGRLLDLIVGTDLRVSFLIVETASVPGAPQHLVAVAASQLRVHGGRLVLADASQATLAAQPPFVHAPVTRTHSEIVAQALRDVDRSRRAVARLEEQSARSSGEPKARIDRQLLALRQDQPRVEDMVARMDAADPAQWQALEMEIREAATRLRRAVRALPA